MINTLQLVAEFRQQLSVHKYAQSSIKSYTNCLSKFLKAFEKHLLDTITEKQVGMYMAHLVETENISDSYQKQMLRTIARFYEWNYDKQLNLSCMYPKQTPGALPKHLSKHDMKKMLEVTDNLKHLCILKLLYGGGLRVSEVLNLRKKDIDAKHQVIHVCEAKGLKDRKIMLSSGLLSDLLCYQKEYRPKTYLFEGQGNACYTAKSIQNIVKNAAQKAGINEPVTPHMLRHSFAVHLVEHGIDLERIQELMGHSSIKTTQMYMQVVDVSKTGITSPLEAL